MNVKFEELSEPKRAGGVEAATSALRACLVAEGLEVVRSSERGGARGLPACVHFHGIWCLRLAQCLNFYLKNGVPCVVTPHGMLDPWPLRHKALKKKIGWHVYQKRLLNAATILHATSEREAEQFRKLGLKSNIAVIPWGVNIPCSKPICPDSGVKTAVFLGRVFPVKGLPMLIQAWADVRPRGWRLLIAGPDEAGHQAELESQISAAGVGDVISLVGSLGGEVKTKFLFSSKLFILPTHSENFGLVVPEALAHGLPVITTQGAPWQLLEEERCGWWTSVTVDGIAAALREATSKPAEELADMGERGRAVVAERFAWPAIAQQFVQLYEGVLAKKGEREEVLG